ncbi:hypothetical protein GIB67_019519 [Kingdonia uniflora]|uniref:Uncharacterized protein n=1 Tax=Kingdonia uniflora TaxID=39325 RepID=A0A7J7N055_9MAGN|nr:hypothetical protein GIB67_019519 [Kingdonia uniflora]
MCTSSVSYLPHLIILYNYFIIIEPHFLNTLHHLYLFIGYYITLVLLYNRSVCHVQ